MFNKSSNINTTQHETIRNIELDNKHKEASIINQHIEELCSQNNSYYGPFLPSKNSRDAAKFNDFPFSVDNNHHHTTLQKQGFESVCLSESTHFNQPLSKTLSDPLFNFSNNLLHTNTTTHTNSSQRTIKNSNMLLESNYLHAHFSQSSHKDINTQTTFTTDDTSSDGDSLDINCIIEDQSVI